MPIANMLAVTAGWGREAYLNKVLKKLNLEYPYDSDD
jgi:hypothetical protein